MKKFKMACGIILGVLVLFSCNKGNNQATVSSDSTVTTIVETITVDAGTETESGEPSYLRIITIETGETVLLNSPEMFLQIAILYNYYNQIWLNEVYDVPEVELENYLQNKRTEFYNSIGITEKDYVDYSGNNFTEINNLLKYNQTLADAYYASQDY